MSKKTRPQLEIVFTIDSKKIIEEQIRLYGLKNKTLGLYDFYHSNVPQNIEIILRHKNATQILKEQTPKKVSLKSLKKKTKEIELFSFLKEFYDFQSKKSRATARRICTIIELCYDQSGAAGINPPPFYKPKAYENKIFLYDFLFLVKDEFWKFRNIGEKGIRLFEEYLLSKGFYFLKSEEK